jgi:hypothetical protein
VAKVAQALGPFEPPGTAPEVYFTQWHTDDAALSGRVVAPCLAATSVADFDASTSPKSRCRTSSRSYRLTEFSVTALEALSSGTENCFVLPQVDSVNQTQYLIFTSAGNTCDHQLGTNVDSVGDSCTQIPSNPKAIAAGGKWQVGLTGVNCSAMESIQMTWKGTYY